MLLGSQLSSTDIEAFRQHAKNVLLEPDPFAGLSESERLSAQLHGIRPLYSTHLAGGVAKTLALLGTVGDVVEVGARQTGTSIASSIVSELLHTANNDLTGAIWSLLAPQLHLLSEAAPNEVLKALRTGLADGGPLVPPILAEGEQGPPLSLPLSVHTRVQWALDNLVWSPTYFDATVSVYARLAELDPGGTWGARPARG